MSFAFRRIVKKKERTRVFDSRLLLFAMSLPEVEVELIHQGILPEAALFGYKIFSPLNYTFPESYASTIFTGVNVKIPKGYWGSFVLPSFMRTGFDLVLSSDEEHVVQGPQCFTQVRLSASDSMKELKIEILNTGRQFTIVRGDCIAYLVLHKEEPFVLKVVSSVENQ